MTDRPISDAAINRLAYDVALRYDSPEDIALRYDIPLPTLEAIMGQPAFKKAVILAEREITEAGTHFRLKARKLSALVVDELSTIAVSPSVEPADRIRAISELTKLAGYQAEAGQTNVQVNVDLRAALDAADARDRDAIDAPRVRRALAEPHEHD